MAVQLCPPEFTVTVIVSFGSGSTGDTFTQHPQSSPASQVTEQLSSLPPFGVWFSWREKKVPVAGSGFAINEATKFTPLTSIWEYSDIGLLFSSINDIVFRGNIALKYCIRYKYSPAAKLTSEPFVRICIEELDAEKDEICRFPYTVVDWISNSIATGLVRENNEIYIGAYCASLNNVGILVTPPKGGKISILDILPSPLNKPVACNFNTP